jgi:hypothetical protein
MKAHIGVDANSGLVHTVVGTAANVNDVTQAGGLLHGEEEAGLRDAGARANIAIAKFGGRSSVVKLFRKGAASTRSDAVSHKSTQPAFAGIHVLAATTSVSTPVCKVGWSTGANFGL